MTSAPDNIIERFRSGQVPLPGRLAAAQGALPLPPEQLLMVLFILRKDPENEVRSAVIETIQGMPDGTLLPVLQHKKLHPAVLDFYARVLFSRNEILESILINSSTHDKTIEYLASRVPVEFQMMIATNQARLERHPPISSALQSNPNLDPSVGHRLEEILENIARSVASTPAAAPATTTAPEAEPTPAEETAATEEDAPASTALAAHEQLLEEEAEAEKILAALEAMDEGLLDDAGVAELEEALDDGLESRGGSLQVKLASMSIIEKIQLARSGSAEARSLMIRDKNKTIRKAVLGSPKLTDMEIESFASNRSLPDEVLRSIASNRAWVKNYSIMHKLVTNPKSPVPLTMRFISRLVLKDLKDLTKNRNIPAALRSQAQRLHDKKTKPKKAPKTH